MACGSDDGDDGDDQAAAADASAELAEDVSVDFTGEGSDEFCAEINAAAGPDEVSASERFAALQGIEAPEELGEHWDHFLGALAGLYAPHLADADLSPDEAKESSSISVQYLKTYCDF